MSFGSKLYAAESIHAAAMALDLPSVTVTQKRELAVFQILFWLSPDDRWCCWDMNRMSYNHRILYCSNRQGFLPMTIS